jgi:uracil-DNA glycosylase family 4
MFPACEQCQIYRGCQSKKMKPSGKGEKRILIVGDYPGIEEDREGRQFVGPSGRYLRGVLDDYGIDMNRDCVTTNALICYSENPGSHKTAIADCRPNLLRTIREVNPEIILLLGGSAVRSLIAHLWKGEVGVIGRWVGWRIPCQSINTCICPSWNPAHIVYERNKDNPNKSLELHFREHILAAVSLLGRPWKEVPDYRKQVEVIFNPEEAAARIGKYTSRLVAFDYETATLKSQSPHAEIVCCGVCWQGKETIAFPWTNGTRKAMKALLENPDVGKIGASNQFEHLHSESQGIEVRGWIWDTVNNAHLLDTRIGGITGVKFQAFVQKGVEDYAYNIAPFLESDGGSGNSKNRIREVDPRLLMIYCGMDALVEWHIAMKQAEEAGVIL